MYHAIVRRQMRRTFDRVSDGDWSAALDVMATDVKQVVPGETAVGGEQRSRDAVRAWSERMTRLFPVLRFEVHDVVSSGWPWRTTVAVHFLAHVTPAAGPPYVNPGVRVFALRWGKVVSVREHFDTSVVAAALERMAAGGVAEAAAAPIA